jgi:small redox-active disulfide protein 2
MKRENEVWIIGTDPPCPRCHHLTNMVHDLLSELNLSIRVKHLSFTDKEAVDFANTMGLVPGTAKAVAQKGEIDMDWQRIHQLVAGPENAPREKGEAVCCPAVAEWTPELDELLRPCQEQALNLGIMMTPVLVLSGRVYHQGSVPGREQTKAWLSRTYAKVGEITDGQMIVEVLGPGCANCEKAYQNAFEAVEQLGLGNRVKIVKITDINEFAKKGVHITPGLIINGEVVSKGKVLEVDQIVRLLKGKKHD